MSDHRPAKKMRLDGIDLKLFALIEEVSLDVDRIPEAMRAKAFVFARNDETVQIVSSVTSAPTLVSIHLQDVICQSFKLSVASFLEVVTEMCKGRLPSCMVVHADRVLWFALNTEQRVVILDVSDWKVLPDMTIREFQCTQCSSARLRNFTSALQDLGESIQGMCHKMTSSEYLDMTTKMQAVYAASGQ